MSNGPGWRPPRPLPPRDQWQMSAPIFAEELRPIANADPGMAIYPDTTRRPRRSLAWRLQLPTDRWPGYVVPSVDHGPEIAAETAPARVPVEPLRLEPLRPYDEEPPAIPQGNPGADLADLLRRRLDAIAADTRPLGIHPETDPGPHDAEPPTTRWRWWQRTWTRWRTRDRKPED